jgi:hypothetical protein
MGVNPGLARLMLGQAQRGTGQKEAGTATLEKVINDLRTAALEGEQRLGLLARALNFGAPEKWDEVLQSFHGRSDLHTVLSLLRWRPPEEMSLTVQDMVTALEMEPSEQRAIRTIARQQRSRWPQEFDAAWRDIAGDIPAWFALDTRLEMQVMAWWNTPTWILSRDYLKSHPTLLESGTDIVLEEFELEGDAELVELHRHLLSAARDGDADAAYEAMLVSIEINDWTGSDNPEEYLAEHGELLRPEVMTALQEEGAVGDVESAQFAAVLELAQRGEAQAAFRAMKEPASVFRELQPAWRSKDIARLASLATIARATGDAAVRRKAMAVLATVRVLEQRSEESEALMSEALQGSTDVDRLELAAIAGDAIANYPAAAAELARLVQRLHAPNLDAALESAAVEDPAPAAADKAATTPE